MSHKRTGEAHVVEKGLVQEWVVPFKHRIPAIQKYILFEDSQNVINYSDDKMFLVLRVQQVEVHLLHLQGFALSTVLDNDVPVVESTDAFEDTNETTSGQRFYQRNWSNFAEALGKSNSHMQLQLCI